MKHTCIQCFHYYTIWVIYTPYDCNIFINHMYSFCGAHRVYLIQLILNGNVLWHCFDVELLYGAHWNEFSTVRSTVLDCPWDLLLLLRVMTNQISVNLLMSWCARLSCESLINAVSRLWLSSLSIFNTCKLFYIHTHIIQRGEIFTVIMMMISEVGSIMMHQCRMQSCWMN